jgi:hypothetical protein
METFTELRALTENPCFLEQKKKILESLSDGMIDAPIVGLIRDFNKLPYCFTMQCCYGHFLYNGQQDRYNVEPLPVGNDIAKVEYRIAYIAFCIQNNDLGKRFLDDLKKLPAIDRETIQLGCAGWFWQKQVNSYALQVEPDRYKHQDQATLGYEEALHVEKVRNTFFDHLKRLIDNKERLCHL